MFCEQRPNGSALSGLPKLFTLLSFVLNFLFSTFSYICFSYPQIYLFICLLFAFTHKALHRKLPHSRYIIQYELLCRRLI